jgi:hypothetical protein
LAAARRLARSRSANDGRRQGKQDRGHRKGDQQFHQRETARLGAHPSLPVPVPDIHPDASTPTPLSLTAIGQYSRHTA